jgi:hypothetical protein
MTEAPSALNRATTESAVATARPRQPLNPRAMNLVYQALIVSIFAAALATKLSSLPWQPAPHSGN